MLATATESTRALFSSVRYPEIREVSLLPGRTTDDILATGITWEEFCCLWEDKKLRLTTSASITLCGYPYNNRAFFRSYIFCINVPSQDGGTISRPTRSMYVDAPGLAAATSTCDFLLRLLTTSKQQDIRFYGPAEDCRLPFTGENLSRFFAESRSKQRVTLKNILLDEDQCHALATVSRQELILEYDCRLKDDNGCHNSFIECLQGDRGPTELNKCSIDCRVLADALRGNTRVVKLKLARHVTTNTGMNALARALAENHGLEDLSLYDHSISDENWEIMCQSLQSHPALTKLNLRSTGQVIWVNGRCITMSRGQKVKRARALADMLLKNTVLQTISFSRYELDPKIYWELISPRLQTNLYRPRVIAINRAGGLLRRALLQRALQSESVRNNPSLVWLFLSENMDVFVSCGSSKEEKRE
jgi:hypothetical protein